MMKHIVFYSGGLGSWATAKRVIEAHGREDVTLLFTDTFIEDDDLYRFLLETTEEMFTIDMSDLVERMEGIPPVSHETMGERKQFLTQLASVVNERTQNFVWTADGRDPWEVFKDVRYIGNSRIAQCSHKLKQDAARTWVENNTEPDNTTLYLGIDWSEDHRRKAPIKNWTPYKVEFPMCEEPYVDNTDLMDSLKRLGIRIPRLYTEGFSHNNCGGFCVRAGQGHFVNLLRTNPELYRYHEEREQEMIKYLGGDIAILRRTRNKIRHSLTLKQLREEYEVDSQEIDLNDVGGCGCFVQEV